MTLSAPLIRCAAIGTRFIRIDLTGVGIALMLIAHAESVWAAVKLFRATHS
jgi:hypothetical protein